MPVPELWRTTRFRLTLLYGAAFALALITLLGLIYWQTAGFLSHQVDQIIRVETAAMLRTDAESLPGRIQEEIARDPRHVDLYGLFSRDGVWITGNVQRLPSNVPIDGAPQELHRQDGYPLGARALVARLPWGELLVVGRDVTQLAEFRRIILRALFWSGGLIVVIGLAAAVLVSVQPLRRLRQMQDASARIMGGDLDARLPTAGRHDELDMLANIANTMIDEMQQLLAEAKTVGDTVAHDLRTPLTRLRLLLARVRQETDLSAAHQTMLDQALGEADALLARFHALLRISEIENQQRRAGFTVVDLSAIVEQARELYAPLAEDRGLMLAAEASEPAPIEADAELLFEAISNLIDNAIKFTAPGGRILLRLSRAAEGPELQVVDNGPGVPVEERGAVLQRFYRSERDRPRPGSGLGLSIVAAIARLHGFALSLEDTGPGLRVSIKCWPKGFGD